MKVSRIKMVRGRWVVAQVNESVHQHGAIVVDGDKIKEIGDWKSLRARYPHCDVIGNEESAIVPGFINAHHHSHAIPSILGGISDNVLEPWILDWHCLRPVDRYLNTLISAGVQLGSGVTSVVDMLSTGGSAEQVFNTAEQALKAYTRSGIKAAQAIGCSVKSLLVSGEGEDQRFLQWLPDSVRIEAESLISGKIMLDDADYFALMGDLQNQVKNNNRVDLWYGPPGPQWVTENCLIKATEQAEYWDSGIQTHVNESYYEKLHGSKFYGMPTMKYLETLGILGPRFTIAHGTWLVDEEIGIMAESGAAVSHNPSSNLRLRAGIAPFQKLLENNVTTGIGMDSTTINDDEDMFSEIRLAMRLQCNPRVDQVSLNINEVMTASLQGGAKLMGKADSIGKLVPGAQADLLVLDTQRMTWPWVSPEIDPVEMIYLRAVKGDISKVMIDGEIVCEEGRPTRFDLLQAVTELVDQISTECFPVDKKKAVDAVRPYLQKWYSRWH